MNSARPPKGAIASYLILVFQLIYSCQAQNLTNYLDELTPHQLTTLFVLPDHLS